MDFSLSADQEALRQLVVSIFTDRCQPAHLREIDDTATRIDADLWRTLVDAGVTCISFPEAAGGSGLGFIDTCVVLEEVGRYAAPVPALATMVLGGAPIAAFGDASLLADGAIVTAALIEPVGDPAAPATTATADGSGWRLQGEKLCVPAGTVASHIVVSATIGGSSETGLFLVASPSDGLTVTPEETTANQFEAMVTLDGVAATRLGDGTALEWLLERAATAAAVMMAGVCERAVRLTADYTKQRAQFDRIIATFQAVSQRAADAYIDTEAIRLTAWQAAWRLHVGKPAATQVASAKFWAAEGGQRVVAAAQHLHGGVGVDRDYPLHRYYLWAKQLELMLGSATPSLVRLGRLIAE